MRPEPSDTHSTLPRPARSGPGLVRCRRSSGPSRAPLPTAAADENAGPDSPAGPLDVDVTVPVDSAENASGTPGGQSDASEHHNEISTEKLTEPIQIPGNAVVLDWAMPVQLSGNPVGLLGGGAETRDSASQSVSETGNVTTDGSEGALSGNIPDVPATVVAQMYEISGELLGKATAVATNDADVLVGGEEPQFNLDLSDKQLGVNELPSLAGTGTLDSRGSALPTDMLGAGLFSGDLLQDGLLGGELLAGDLPAANVPPGIMIMEDLPVKALPNQGRAAGELPMRGTMTGRLPARLPALGGVNMGCGPEPSCCVRRRGA